MTTLTINCRQSMDSSPTMSMNIWQRIKANPTSHMLALATGLAIAAVLTVVICGCKWWLKRRTRSSRERIPVPYPPVYEPSLNINRPLAPVIRENRILPHTYSRIPMIPERYSSLPYPLNNNSFVKMDTI